MYENEFSSLINSLLKREWKQNKTKKFVFVFFSLSFIHSFIHIQFNNNDNEDRENSVIETKYEILLNSYINFSPDSKNIFVFCFFSSLIHISLYYVYRLNLFTIIIIEWSSSITTTAIKWVENNFLIFFIFVFANISSLNFIDWIVEKI